ncbi:MAG: glycosyltransferase [Acidimicrobiales bacterium]
MSERSSQPSQSPQVEILMATYNGEKYIASQIESILAQDHQHILLTIFDDGSTDGTLHHIEQYLPDKRVRLVASERTGLPQVYFRLLGLRSPTSEYVGYADQDDVWLPGKVSRSLRLLRQAEKSGKGTAVEKINGQREYPGEYPGGYPGEYPENPLPVLYCSRSFITDVSLRVIGATMLPRYPPSFTNALVQGIAPGCTMLFNKEAAELLASWAPQHAPMHDWWTYLVISATGEVVYDPLPTLLYRQHSNNARGVMENGRWSWRKRALWHFQEGARSSTLQATELREWLQPGSRIQRSSSLQGSHPDPGTSTSTSTGAPAEPGVPAEPGIEKNSAIIRTDPNATNPDILAELNSFLDSQHTLAGRVRYALSGAAHRQRRVDDLVYRALYLFGRI